jgi:hypothetical protein
MFKKFSTYICLKKYIKWGFWRVAVCPSYARFLKVNAPIVHNTLKYILTLVSAHVDAIFSECVDNLK